MIKLKHVKLQCDMCNKDLGYFPIKASSTDKLEISKISISGQSQPILCMRCIELWECINPDE